MTAAKLLPFCLLTLAVLAGPALGDETRPSRDTLSASAQERVDKSVKDGASTADANCAFRMHDCEICAQTNGRIVCSSVGIACQPMKWRCLEPSQAK